MALSSTKIIKVIVVTDDVERTAEAYRKLLGTGQAVPEAEQLKKREPYMRYRGQAITDTPMKVESVFTDNFWFEIIEPMGDNDPWADWLRAHGTSICSICLLSAGAIEKDEEVMKAAGYESVFKHEKGYEAYEYFDTSADLGVLLEMKEHY